MIRRLLAGVDFSETSRHAAAAALSLAWQIGATVTFVTVLDAGDLRVAMQAGLHGFETDDDVRRQVHDWIEQEYAVIEADRHDVTTSRDIRRGIPERELLAAIDQHQPDIVVLGADGITKRFPMGSRAEYVLRHCSVPLLLVH